MTLGSIPPPPQGLSRPLRAFRQAPLQVTSQPAETGPSTSVPTTPTEMRFTHIVTYRPWRIILPRPEVAATGESVTLDAGRSSERARSRATSRTRTAMGPSTRSPGQRSCTSDSREVAQAARHTQTTHPRQDAATYGQLYQRVGRARWCEKNRAQGLSALLRKEILAG